MTCDNVWLIWEEEWWYDEDDPGMEEPEFDHTVVEVFADDDRVHEQVEELMAARTDPEHVRYYPKLWEVTRPKPKGI